MNLIDSNAWARLKVFKYYDASFWKTKIVVREWFNRIFVQEVKYDIIIAQDWKYMFTLEKLLIDFKECAKLKVTTLNQDEIFINVTFELWE